MGSETRAHAGEIFSHGPGMERLGCGVRIGPSGYGVHEVCYERGLPCKVY